MNETADLVVEPPCSPRGNRKSSPTQPPGDAHIATLGAHACIAAAGPPHYPIPPPARRRMCGPARSPARTRIAGAWQGGREDSDEPTRMTGFGHTMAGSDASHGAVLPVRLGWEEKLGWEVAQCSLAGCVRARPHGSGRPPRPPATCGRNRAVSPCRRVEW